MSRKGAYLAWILLTAAPTAQAAPEKTGDSSAARYRMEILMEDLTPSLERLQALQDSYAAAPDPSSVAAGREALRLRIEALESELHKNEKAFDSLSKTDAFMEFALSAGKNELARRKVRPDRESDPERIREQTRFSDSSDLLRKRARRALEREEAAFAELNAAWEGKQAPSDWPLVAVFVLTLLALSALRFARRLSLR